MQRAVVLGLALLAVPSPASACDPIQLELWSLDPAQASDTSPPSAPDVSVQVTRFRGDSSGCQQSTSSCGDQGTIILDVAATDDRTAPEQLGYDIRVVGGEGPEAFELATAMRFRAGFGSLVYTFNVDEPGFSIDVEVRAVDGNGNLGAPTLVTIADGGDGGGCASARRSGSLVGFGLTALALGFARRRRRA